MKKLKIVLSALLCMIGFSALSMPQDSVIVRIDARNQQVIGSSKKGLTLKEEVATILEKKGIVLNDSIWQQVRKAIRKEDTSPQRLEFEANGQRIVIGLMRPSTQTEPMMASAPLDKSNGVVIRDGREEVKISLKEGIHVKDGSEEVLIDWDGIRVKDGSEETKIIWGSESTKKKEQGPNFYQRNGFDLDLGLNNWTGDLGSQIIPAVYPAPLLSSDKTLNTLGSRYVSMNWMRYANLSKGKKKAFRIGYGIGIEWYNMMFDHSRVLQNTTNGISFLPVVNDGGKEKVFTTNKLAASYVTVPIMPHFSFDVKSPIQMIALGAYVSYRIDSWVKTKEQGTGDKNHTSGSYQLNDFRVGTRFEVALRSFPDFFLNMDLSPMFQKDKGSNLQLISFGVKLL